MNVAVFCSSSSELHADFVDAATSLGQWLGSNGHVLVWGGCNVGLMNVVAEATRKAGGRTIAVLPKFLEARGLRFQSADEFHLTDDMMLRKAMFRQKAEAFVALPGGVGTWEEVLEVIALRKLGQLDSPIVLLNIRDYYRPLIDQFRRSVAEGFSAPDTLKLFRVAESAGALPRLLSKRDSAALDLGPVG